MVAKPVSEPTPKASAAQTAGPAPEAAKADVAPDGRASAETTPLVADFNPSASGGDDETIVEAFRATL